MCSVGIAGTDPYFTRLVVSTGPSVVMKVFQLVSSFRVLKLSFKTVFTNESSQERFQQHWYPRSLPLLLLGVEVASGPSGKQEEFEWWWVGDSS